MCKFYGGKSADATPQHLLDHAEHAYDRFLYVQLYNAQRHKYDVQSRAAKEQAFAKVHEWQEAAEARESQDDSEARGWQEEAEARGGP